MIKHNIYPIISPQNVVGKALGNVVHERSCAINIWKNQSQIVRRLSLHCVPNQKGYRYQQTSLCIITHLTWFYFSISSGVLNQTQDVYRRDSRHFWKNWECLSKSRNLHMRQPICIPHLKTIIKLMNLCHSEMLYL